LADLEEKGERWKRMGQALKVYHYISEEDAEAKVPTWAGDQEDMGLRRGVARHTPR